MQELKQGSETVSKQKYIIAYSSLGLDTHLLDGTQVVIKVADTPNIKQEYEIYKELINNGIPGIIRYICYSDSILVMEYIKNKSFALYNFQNINAIRSIIKQVLCISIDAYMKFGFVHGDLHCQNILIKHTTCGKPLTFEFAGRTVNIATHGFKAKLMDFELSKTKQPIDAFYKDISTCLASSLTRYISDSLRNPLSLHDVTREMMVLREQVRVPVDAYLLLNLLPLIDSIN